ncbi:hypothetical protein NSQ62_08380 [Solibacillus sp. FSL H8-0523]|uniref:hypothetical protein n=1 Tax=Solibacillus sp. FSL H8-0523 TaxID=2954511 RepID=UPI0031017B85
MDDLVKIYQEATARLQNAVIETPARIKLLNETISNADLEIQDLLHLVELGRFNAAEGYSIANQIKEARIKRRNAKDEMETLFNIKSVINQQSKLEPHVLGINKTIERTIKQKSERKYTARVRTDLTARINQLQQNKRGE